MPGSRTFAKVASGPTPGTLRKAALLLGALALVTSASMAMQAQDGSSNPGCTLQKDIYTCNWETFRQALKHAQTIAVETQPMDRSTAAQLRQLAQSLGKTVTPASGGEAGATPPELTFLLIPMDTAGIHYGPEDHSLATLRIYAPGPNTTRGTLLWAETLRGQGDRPWPSQVHTLIQQFQDRLPRR